MIGTCELCKRKNVETTRHHLIPVTTHKNKKTKRETTHHERHTVIPLCCPCHNQIHKIFTEKELERTYNTVESLLAHEDVSKFVNWLVKRNVGDRLKVR